MCTYGNKILNTLLFHATKKKNTEKIQTNPKLVFDSMIGIQEIYIFSSPLIVHYVYE